MNIKIRGEHLLPVAQTAPATAGLWLKDTYHVAASVRAVSPAHDVTLDKDDLLEFVFDDDQQTTWLCGTDSLMDLFPEAPIQTRSESANFEIPASISPTVTNRGIGSIMTGVAIKLINIFAKKGLDGAVTNIAKQLEEHQLGLSTIGLQQLKNDFSFGPRIGASDKPFLLFLHGTGSSTSGSFLDLSKNADLWQQLCQTYADNMLAFQHRTLTESPLKNVLDLVTALPDNATLHIISHSRGGLVGDILSRFCIQDSANSGFSAEEIAYLDKCGKTDEIKTIADITALMQKKHLTIAKYIRVACPGAGTSLVAKRLDHFFNILGNLIGFATGGSGNVIYQLFRQLIAAVINEKDNDGALPGLAAMNPESPFIKILNDQNFKGVIDTRLTVIAGNSKAKLNAKALVVIASKLFFQADNDLIVNTGAMYRGARRLNDLQYFFDEGTNVDHFSYFKNPETQRILLEAIKQQDTSLPIPGFSYMTPAQAAAQRNALLNLDGGKLFMDKVTGNRPIVLILPGIMGSNLDVNGTSIWINYWKFITGQLEQLAMGATGVIASSIVASSYRQLATYLSATYDVVTFPFDWRLQMNDCAALLDQKIIQLLSYNQPIKVVAHSLGGVLMRDFLINHDNTWEKLNASKGFKMVLLGAPLGGAFRIPNVLFGMDAIIKKIATLDIIHTKKELLEVFAQLPGLLSLLPLTVDADNDMANAAVWTKMRTALGDSTWPIPNADSLTQFKAYRQNINAKMDGIDYTNIAYVAGHDTATPCGYQIEEKADGQELVFLSTSEGDQSVTWASGIPQKMLAQNKVYFVEATHGELANTPSMFKALTDLLQQGTTLSLSRQKPVARGGATVFRTPQIHDFDFSAAGLEDTIMGLNTSETVKAGDAPLNVSVVSGDLLYADHPILAGHFDGDGILYAEQAIDNYLNGSLRQRHTLGLYPGPIGTSLTIITPNAKIQGALIIGLDDPSSLTGTLLAKSVEQGICDYLLHQNKRVVDVQDSSQSASSVLGISALIIGCAYGGLTVEAAVTAILEGVRIANSKIKKLLDDGARLVGNVEFVEKYEDRALSALHILDRLSKDPKSLDIILYPKLKIRIGYQRRVNMDATEEWWNRITVSRVTPTDGSKLDYLQFSSAAGGAKVDQRNLYSNLTLLDGLIKEISDDNTWSQQSAQILFELIIPKDFKEQLKRQCNIVWVLDKQTAGYPWELLHDGANEAYPFSVSAGMVRQLSTNNANVRSTAVIKKSALVIADPDLKGYISQLPAAKIEGEQTVNLFKSNGYDTNDSINESGIAIIEKLFTGEYKIVHIASHGMFQSEQPEAGGIVIGNNAVLSSREFSQMRFIPDMMFINCCYLGKIDGAAEEFYAERYRLAANIGTQLIENGVKAVIVCGWAVNDTAAQAFAQTFYKLMFEGYNFGDAVRKARKKCFEGFSNNTWGAYQCYGDPFYKLTVSDSWQAEKEHDYTFYASSEAETVLFNLLNSLEMPENDVATVFRKMAAIATAVDLAGVRTPLISEREASIYVELGAYKEALVRFEALMQTEKGLSFDAAEKYCNVRGKSYLTDFLDSGKPRLDYAALMKSVTDDLSSLITFQKNSERYSLLGSAWKRMTVIEETPLAQNDALKQAAFNYHQAQDITSGSYPTTNWLEMESLLILAGDHDWKAMVRVGENGSSYTSPSKAAAQKQLKALAAAYNGPTNDLVYWDLVGRANVKLCAAIIENSTKDEALWSEIMLDFANIWGKAGSIQKQMAEHEHITILAAIAKRIPGAAAQRLHKRLMDLLASFGKVSG